MKSIIAILLLLPILLTSCSRERTIDDLFSGPDRQEVKIEKMGVAHSMTAPIEVIVGDNYTVTQEIKNGSEKR
jgi:hypothetical protein